MFDRRRFLQNILALSAGPLAVSACASTRLQRLSLQSDPNRVIDIPEGFTYTVVSRVGDLMDDGLPVPGAHDGMAAFPREDGRVALVCNHELTPASHQAGAFRDAIANLPDARQARLYDQGHGKTPGLGGTTTTIYNPRSGETERQFLSLCGTDINCAGGKTPWGSWLSCEESFASPGSSPDMRGTIVHREQRHGYVFEVPSSANELVKPVPIRDMGRFEHEAAAVQADTGIVYLTEDKWDSLFYRYLPHVRGQLQQGGRLQALAIDGAPSARTQNWEKPDVRIGESLRTRWIDLDNVDSDENDLRLRGAAAGAAQFGRGEGLTAAGRNFAFTCTNGGPARLGQIFEYEPSPYESTPQEQEVPGRLTLIAEATPESLLKNCDNLTMAPWGDLIVCEDTGDQTDHCALVGVRADGAQYLIANNAYSNSELAGVCFSPDGRTLFVNIQYPGTTVAISGPWPR